MRFLISSLESIGAEKALIGGMVVDGQLRAGMLLSAENVTGKECVFELRTYGKSIEEVPKNMSAAIVVGLEWARQLHLGGELTDGT